MRDSMIFYRSFYEAIKDLPDDQFAQCARAILAYALDDQKPEEGGIAGVVYAMAKPQIDKNNTRYQNGMKGGRPKTKQKPRDNQEITKSKPKTENSKPNDNVNVNDNVIKESTLKGTKEKFKPPTVEEVREYCAERGSTVDAEQFVDFYESKGWMVGKNKMKDWKSAVRNWERSNRQEKTAKVNNNKFNNFHQRDYDFNDLEKQLLRGG